MSRIHIIWNPVAGNGAAAAAFEKVDARLKELKIDYTEARSEYAGHAVLLAKEAVEAGHELIVAMGGDGTVREVATSMLGSDIPLGIIPCGTGNDLSRPLKIPREPLAALDTALNGKQRRMDAARANDEIFFNVAGFGFDVDVLDYVLIYKKKYKNGSIAYLRGLIAAIKGLKARRTVIETPEGTFTTNVMILACGNGTHFGGGMCVTPEADPFDGLLDVCIAHDVKKWMLPYLLPKFIRGKHLGLKNITYFKTTKLSARCEPISRIEVDGEIMQGTPVTVEVLPASISVMVS